MNEGNIAVELSLSDPDKFYAHLLALHDGLDQEMSMRLNATIILMMANQIGDDALLHRIIDEAASLWLRA